MSRKLKHFLLIFLVVLVLVFTIPSIANLGGLLGDMQSNVGSGGGGTASSDVGAVRGVTVPAELVF